VQGWWKTVIFARSIFQFMSFSCIIVDDEPNALHLMQDYIGRTLLLDLKGTFSDAVEALEFLRKKKAVDVIFTDVNMPMLSGMDMADILPRSQRFIFTTAYSEHALSSFSYYVIDYLLKPISFKRFSQSVAKIEQSFLHSTKDTSAVDQEFIFVKSGKQFIKIIFSEIFFIMGAKEYVSIQTRKGKILVYIRMKGIGDLLPNYFMRVHHSYIVNTKYLERVQSGIVVVAGINIPVSDSYKNSVIVFVDKTGL
jgi:DNA-binding LytR/AlgR family response regulator